MTSRERTQRIGHTLHRLGAVASTQLELRRLAEAGAPEGIVVTATHQTAGRGRRGRRWLDAPGDSLLASILLRPRIPPAAAPQLSLVGAVAVVDALRGLAGLDARIRWPNDVLVAERKICGILPEAAASSEGALEHVVLGIGLNVNQAEFAAPIHPLATSIRIETGQRHSIDTVLEAVLAALDRRYVRFFEDGLATIREAWLERAHGMGRRAMAGDGRAGIAMGLAEDGALLVQTDDGDTVRVLAGEPAAEEAHAPGR